MASTFTLKRKTYTEFDYHNDIATKGFRDGFDLACEKLFAKSIEATIAESINKRFGHKLKSPVDFGDVRRMGRGKEKNILDIPYDKEVYEFGRNELNRLRPGGSGGKQVQFQQRAASFIGKGYLY